LVECARGSLNIEVFLEHLLSTLTVAFIIIVIALLAMAAGWFAKGHTNLLCGRCGSNPDKKEKKAGMRCDLCDHAPPLDKGEKR